MPTDLTTQVERRYRRRRAGRVGVAAAIVLGLTAGGTALLPQLAGTAPPSADPHRGPGFATQPAATQPAPADLGPLAIPASAADLPPAAEVWPDAVHSIPRSLDGGHLTLVGRLSQHRLLLTSERNFQHPEKLYAWDARDRSATFLADLSGPDGAQEYFPQEFTTSGTEIIWWAADNVSSTPGNIYVWAVAKTGGTPRLIGMPELPEGAGVGARDLSDLRATDDAVYWSALTGGVYTMPLAGGPVRALTGFEDYRFVAFPWAAELDPAAVASRTPEVILERPGIVRKLRNVLTGAEIDIAVPEDARELWCVPAFCVGTAQSEYFAMRPDGSHRISLGTTAYHWDQVAEGRYITGYDGDAIFIADAETGKAGLLPGDNVGRVGDLLVWVDDQRTRFAP